VEGLVTGPVVEDLSWKQKTNLLFLHCQKVQSVALRSVINLSSRRLATVKEVIGRMTESPKLST